MQCGVRNGWGLGANIYSEEEQNRRIIGVDNGEEFAKVFGLGVLYGVKRVHMASFHSSPDDIGPVESLNPKERSSMTFDDVML